MCIFGNICPGIPYPHPFPPGTIYGQEFFAYSEMAMANWSILRIDKYNDIIDVYILGTLLF